MSGADKGKDRKSYPTKLHYSNSLVVAKGKTRLHHLRVVSFSLLRPWRNSGDVKLRAGPGDEPSCRGGNKNYK